MTGRLFGIGNVRTLVLIGCAALIEAVLVLNLLWPVQPAAGGGEDDWPWVGGLMAFPVAAVLILIHRPDNRVGWALGVTAVSAGLIFFMSWYPGSFRDAPLSRLIEALARIPAIGQFAGIVALLYLFPTGRCTSPFFEKVLQAFVATMAVTTTLFLLSPSALAITDRPNPLGVLPDWLGRLGDGGAIILLPFALIGIWSLGLRWRRAGSTERSQLKWFVSGAIFFVSIIVLANLLPEESDDATVDFVASFIVMTAFWSIPGAVVIAVTRYRLYDIDRLINRTLVYILLTAGLGAAYFGLVVGLQALFRPVSGSSDLAIALTTLIVAALFLPARRRVQVLVDRRFNRKAYDAARTIESFGARLRQNVELDSLRYELMTVVDETMEPSQVSLWLRQESA